MPSPRKTSARKTSARPAGRPTGRPAGRPTGRPTGRPMVRHAGASSKPFRERPGSLEMKPTLVKKSEMVGGSAKPARRPVGKKLLLTKPIQRRTMGTKFAGEKTFSTSHGAPRRSAGQRSAGQRSAGQRSAIPRSATAGSPARLIKKGGATLVMSSKPKDVPTATGTVRLNKYISNAGITSRRKADELITQGKVTVNGKVITELGVQIKPFDDTISIDGEVVSPKPKLIYLLLNKPKDTITTTSDEKDRSTVLDYITTQERVYPVGRLDRNTTGVLLLTNDGELTNRLTHPSFEIEREYHVTLDKRLEAKDAKAIAAGGIDIGDGEITGTAELVIGEQPQEAFLKLREGKNREVRRIFETLGYTVEKLDRVNFAGLTHRGMGRGESRALTNAEVHRLRDAAGLEA